MYSIVPEKFSSVTQFSPILINFDVLIRNDDKMKSLNSFKTHYSKTQYVKWKSGSNICDAAQVWGGPRAAEHTKEMPPTKEAGLLTDLTIPQPKEMAAYGLYGPAQAKQN